MFRRTTVSGLILTVTTLIICTGVTPVCTAEPSTGKYEPTWASLKQYPIPEWLRDGKFGIWVVWGIYSVPAYGQNGTWYPFHMYQDPENEQYEYHEETYGPATEFGYKDFIPMLTAEKFDADEWAILFEDAGAKFAGLIAEFHDGFAMWPTEYSEWNATTMGPKRDMVGECERAFKDRDMKFITAFHHAANWFFFPTWDKRFDTSDPRYSGLYGQIHEQDQLLPNDEFLDEWYGKLVEVIDDYDPDLIWFDFALGIIREDLRKKFFAYYYNKAEERGKEVVVTYKGHDFPPGVGLRDLELGQMRDLTYYEWATDTALDDQGAWCYVADAKFKTVDRLVDNLVDRVSKNGYLLLAVGPAPDGTFPEEAKKRLRGLGDWLKTNGEAIYGTRAWSTYGEGAAKLEGDPNNYGFNESDLEYTAEDIRFTAKEDILYAICLDRPGDEITITSFAPEEQEMGQVDYALFPDEIESITMVGDSEELEYKFTDEGLVIQCPDEIPGDYAFAFKIQRKVYE